MHEEEEEEEEKEEEFSLLVGALSPVSHNDYIRAENKVQPISKLFIPQVVIPQVSFSQTTAQIMSTISERKLRKTVTHVLEPIYIPRVLNTGITCICCL